MKPSRILLVDDEDLIRITLEQALTHAGHAVTAVGNGGLAAEHLRNEAYDLVITDIAMEGLDGIQVLQEAKRLDPNVGVIIVTGYGDVDSAIDALRNGAEDYLTKPFDYDELLLRAARCLEKRELRRKLRLYEDILPMCAGCKKVRDDAGAEPGEGTWMPLEEYLSREARVQVSHGYCPECAALYSRR